MRNDLPLHHCQSFPIRTILIRIYTIFHTIALFALLYYRVSSLYTGLSNSPIFAWILMSLSELILSFIWILYQAIHWRPVTRTVFPERLPKDHELPCIDVLIFTADPKKEPPLGVMNTLISAMSLDYPTEKLTVYLSDDGGSPVTLSATREAFKFAKEWVPFCKNYGIKTRCPDAYFSSIIGKQEVNEVFFKKQKMIEFKYNEFKKLVEEAGESDDGTTITKDRPSYIEPIGDGTGYELGRKNEEIPALVYVSREKRHSRPHHFKAGAINAIIRVSSLLSNAPFVLVLDCDMYCNDPTSARQAMCFHLDPEISRSLAFVQFPQNFHNVSKNDIYSGNMKIANRVLWPGFDGLQGPILCGTGFYLKREALLGTDPQKDNNLAERKKFTDSLNILVDTSVLLQEAHFLASCTYEEDTQWGSQIGFMYHSVVEDYFTGFLLHCKGWRSIYYYPSIPPFLGNTPTNLNDCLTQGSRWSSGLCQVGFSKYCPLVYGFSKVSIFLSMAYTWLAFFVLYSLPLLCYGVLPQLYLLKGVALFPKVSDPWFNLFSGVYISAFGQRLYEIIFSGESFKVFWNDERMWMIKSVTCHLFGLLDVIMKSLGLQEVSFTPTNKVDDDEQVRKRYQMDKFDFHGGTILLLPLVTLVILNWVAFILGLGRAILEMSFDMMFGQLFVSFICVIFSLPVIEGIVLRKDKGCIQGSVILYSLAIVTVILSIAFIM